MHKKRLKFFLILPLLMINLFNVVFILYKAKGRGYLREAFQAVVDYFIGFHLIPLVLVILIISLFHYLSKSPTSSFLYKAFLVCLLFVTAINLSLFPEADSWFGLRGFNFERKKTASLNEVISRSPAKSAKLMDGYTQMNEHLRNKTLVIPSSVSLEKDFFFRLFITPGNVLKEDYSFRLSDKDYKSVKNYPMRIFTSYQTIREIKRFIIMDAFPDSKKLTLFIYDENYIFLPSTFIEQHNLKVRD